MLAFSLLFLAGVARADDPAPTVSDTDAAHAELAAAADAIAAHLAGAKADRDGATYQCLAPYASWAERLRRSGDRAYASLAAAPTSDKARHRLTSARDQVVRLRTFTEPECVPWDGHDRDAFLVNGGLGDTIVAGFSDPLSGPESDSSAGFPQ